MYVRRLPSLLQAVADAIIAPAAHCCPQVPLCFPAEAAARRAVAGPASCAGNQAPEARAALVCPEHERFRVISPVGALLCLCLVASSGCLHHAACGLCAAPEYIQQNNPQGPCRRFVRRPPRQQATGWRLLTASRPLCGSSGRALADASGCSMGGGGQPVAPCRGSAR